MTELVNLSIGTAALAVLVYVTRELRGVLRDTSSAQERVAREFTQFLGNHLSAHTAALERLVARFDAGILREGVQSRRPQPVRAAGRTSSARRATR